MQTTCVIDHSLENIIPPDLCRACHPELNTSAAARAKLDGENREASGDAAAQAAHQKPGTLQTSAIAA
jgi:hypothetical protein